MVCYNWGGFPETAVWESRSGFAALRFSLISDTVMRFGGGVFLPRTGNAATGAREQWRFETDMTAAFW
ncbi:MAG: hypothetical protein LBS37_08885 [Treponema sp.]|jgi:hypothetical protein|nr:hypothetical protein [Treponema sp.]